MSHLITDFGFVHGGIYSSIAIVMYISSTIFWFYFTMTLISPENYLVTVIILPLVFTNSILLVYSEASYIALSEVTTYLNRRIFCLKITQPNFYHTCIFEFILKNFSGGKKITVENSEFNRVWSCGTNTDRSNSCSWSCF